MVRLSAGRTEMSRETQLLCLYAGANSIFYGDRLLTTGNPDTDEDTALIREAGLTPMRPAEPLPGPRSDPENACNSHFKVEYLKVVVAREGNRERP
jgi:hypothetical protein